MTRSLRTKLFGIVAIATLALASMAAVDITSTRSVDEQLAEIEARHIPRLELRPRLEADLERLSRGFQDAVAAQDLLLLEATDAHRQTFLHHLSEAGSAVDRAKAVELRSALDEYCELATDVSNRLLADETGEDLVDAMAEMQSRRARVEDLVASASALGERELHTAFEEVLRLRAQSLRIRLGTAFGCLILVIFFTFVVSRQILRSVSELGDGFERFGRGELGTPISVRGTDELALLARRANEMAASLDAAIHARDRAAWLSDGLNGLSRELRGDLDPTQAADKATSFLARYVKAPAGALYYIERGNELRLLGRYAISVGEGEGRWVSSFRVGEGLVGEAARNVHPTVIDSVPADYSRIRSGLGETPPTAIALVPLVPDEEPAGVLELAFLGPVPAGTLQLLASAQSTIAIAIEVGRARAATEKLLLETRAQADRLALQEEELRATNEELEAQQEELRQANEELSQQTDALDEHRRVLEEKNDELEEARTALELRASELATVSSYKSQFLTNMSHELRTPLNSMLLLSNLLAENQSGNLSEKQVGYCKTIHTAGQDLLALINQVLDLARVEAGKVEVTLGSVSLGDLAEHARASFEPVARDKGLDLHIEVEAGLPDAITSDRQRILQIVNNLIANAIKFTDAGSVTLRMRRPGAEDDLGRPELARETTVSFEVVDTGTGIPAEHQERVFSAFEQADASIGRRHGGTGLGLAISRELAELLGGVLLLRSTAGRGSTFVCHLPEGGPKQAVEQPARPRAAKPPTVTLAPLLTRRSGLLVVEDDAVFAEGLVELIREQGHEVWVASTGEDALRLARERRPRGIILDIKLPDIDGWTVMERLRADPATAAIPVHCVSGLDAAAQAASVGAIGYLRKPATREELLRVVESLAPKARDGARTILVVEDDAVVGESLLTQLAKESIHARRVGTAQGALDVLREERFDCLILDLGLPDMDGLELLDRLDQNGGAKLPSVIVYTARALTMDETRRLEAYTDAIVLKQGSSVERLLDEIRMFAGRVARGRGPVAAPARAAAELRGKTVLVVDDDMRTVYALSAMLRSKGFEVHVADTGIAALDALARHPEVDAVLMDIMMPEMDGYTAMQRIRAQPRLVSLPIIALTAKAMKGDEEKCLAAGATAYLPKPVDTDRLLDALRAHIVERA